MLTWAKQKLSRLIGRPVRYQVAAICYRKGEQELEILLITSRRGGRWILPKGWPMPDRSDSESALQEAYEEAGVRGTVSPNAVGTYNSRKKIGKKLKIPIKTTVYAVEVSHLDDSFPESGERDLAWHNIEVAAELIENKEISYLLKRWHENFR